MAFTKVSARELPRNNNINKEWHFFLHEIEFAPLPSKKRRGGSCGHVREHCSAVWRKEISQYRVEAVTKSFRRRICDQPEIDETFIILSFKFVTCPSRNREGDAAVARGRAKSA